MTGNDKLHWLMNGTIDQSNLRFFLKLKTFMRFTKDLALLSTCKRRQVGCVIVPPDFTKVLSIGYNGPCRTTANDSCTGERNQCGCVHAEANALAKLVSEEPAVMLCTCAPCYNCAALTLNVPSIYSVVFLERSKSNAAGEELLRESSGKIKVHYFDTKKLGSVYDDQPTD